MLEKFVEDGVLWSRGRLGGVLSIPPEEESAAEKRSDNHSPYFPETLVGRRQKIRSKVEASKKEGVG